MSKSPLSGAFNENGAPEKKKNKKTGALLILAGVALTTSLGGVFAANTTINLGSNIEFGQGTAATAVCDTSITANVEQSWSSTTFTVSRVGLTGIDAVACGGKTIKVALLDSSGAAICSINGAGTAASKSLGSAASNVYTIADSTDDVITFAAGSAGNTVSYGVTPTGTCNAVSVDKVALTTSN